MKFFVAGGSGLIGREFCQQLLAKGFQVTASYRAARPVADVPNFNSVQADLSLSWPTLTHMDAVIFAAGQCSTYAQMQHDPLEHIHKNVKIVLNGIEQIYRHHIKSVIFISSSTGYAKSAEQLTEACYFTGEPEEKYQAVAYYHRYLEQQLHYLQRLLPQLQLIILRPATVYGENEGFDLERCHLLPALVKKCMDNQKIDIYGRGLLQRDFVQVSDLVRAALLALQHPAKRQTYNISSGKKTSVAELLALIAAAAGLPNLQKHYNDKQEDLYCATLDNSLISKELGFSCQVDLEEGINRLVTAYKKEISLA